MTRADNRSSRSALMARIRHKDTGPELIVRSRLHRLGYRYRLHRKDLPGKPDIVLASRRVVIFVHGCFWHQHEGCRVSHIPKTRVDYWLPKLRKNVERDQAHRARLEALGWAVHVIWECEIAHDRFVEPLVDLLRSRPQKGKARSCSADPEIAQKGRAAIERLRQVGADR